MAGVECCGVGQLALSIYSVDSTGTNPGISFCGNDDIKENFPLQHNFLFGKISYANGIHPT
jgi:hypothetical protein